MSVSRRRVSFSHTLDQPTAQVVAALNDILERLVSDINAPTDRQQFSATTFAGLPASPTAGTSAYVTDSSTVTFGATITGGGTGKVLAFYNGSNWTVQAA